MFVRDIVTDFWGLDQFDPKKKIKKDKINNSMDICLEFFKLKIKEFEHGMKMQHLH